MDKKDIASTIAKIYEMFKDFFEVPCINCGETVFTLPYKEEATHRVKCLKCQQITHIKIINGGIHVFSEEEKCKKCNGTGICPTCNGTGKVTCSNCEGKGYVKRMPFDDILHGMMSGGIFGMIVGAMVCVFVGVIVDVMVGVFVGVIVGVIVSVIGGIICLILIGSRYYTCEKCGGINDGETRGTSEELFAAAEKGYIRLGSGKVECHSCNGTGRCIKCNGAGHR